MADISQVITLGIGVPSSIEHLILIGLNANPAAPVVIDRSAYIGVRKSRRWHGGHVYNFEADEVKQLVNRAVFDEEKKQRRRRK